jgi:hypothetical protein
MLKIHFSFTHLWVTSPVKFLHFNAFNNSSKAVHSQVGFFNLGMGGYCTCGSSVFPTFLSSYFPLFLLILPPIPLLLLLPLIPLALVPSLYHQQTPIGDPCFNSPEPNQLDL